MPDPVDYNIVAGSKQGHLVRFNRVGFDFFDAYDVPILVGRGFRAGDVTGGAYPVLINRRFAEQFSVRRKPARAPRSSRRISREAGDGNIVLERRHEIVKGLSNVCRIVRREVAEAVPYN